MRAQLLVGGDQNYCLVGINEKGSRDEDDHDNGDVEDSGNDDQI